MKYFVAFNGLLFGLFWVIAPALMKDKVIGLITFTNADRQCFNYYKIDYFKDPDSAYIESSRILTRKNNEEELKSYPVIYSNKKYDTIVQVKVRARNSMGGYGAEEVICPLVNNSFDQEEAVLYSVKVATEQLREATCAKVVNNLAYSSGKMKDYCKDYIAQSLGMGRYSE